MCIRDSQSWFALRFAGLLQHLQGGFVQRKVETHLGAQIGSRQRAQGRHVVAERRGKAHVDAFGHAPGQRLPRSITLPQAVLAQGLAQQLRLLPYRHADLAILEDRVDGVADASAAHILQCKQHRVLTGPLHFIGGNIEQGIQCLIRCG